eukprot:scaffold953_cov141-Cylindrotheca_fusiformis.AAC.8
MEYTKEARGYFSFLYSSPSFSERAISQRDFIHAPTNSHQSSSLVLLTTSQACDLGCNKNGFFNMGGEGAKERRRLKRLAESGGGGDKGKQIDKKSAKSNIVRKKKTISKFDKPKGSHNNNFSKTFDKSKGVSQNKKPFHKESSLKNNKKEKKHKKPKHLKRKLEQLGEEDSDARVEILQKLGEWEKKKEMLGIVKNKFPKNERSEDDEGSKPFPRNDGSRVADTETKPFPRTERSEDTKPKPLHTKERNAEAEIKRPQESLSEIPAVKGVKTLNEMPEEEAKPESKTAEDSDSDEDAGVQRRQRGRRRRGKKDTAKQISETTTTLEEPKTKRTKEILKDLGESLEEGEKSNKRYCLGRKPLTDFKIGKAYTGKVVYVKPFGIFIDIGCHSDAFCHVSRLSDDYVESPESLFKEGDEVKPRVVEVDRRKKKITVSLQSEARIADERASLEARQERKGSRKSAKKPKLTPSNDMERGPIDSSPMREGAEIPRKDTPKVAPVGPQKQQRPSPSLNRKINFSAPDESSMNPAELKRARKLARRAARREAAETNGEDPTQ